MLSSDEPPIREFPDRGTLWLLETPQNLHDLLRLVSAEIADRLDFTRAERSPRSFVPDDLRKKEADILYRVPYRQRRGEVFVYVLLEHQSRPDRTMGLRLLSYMVHIWLGQVRAFESARTPGGQWKLSPIIPMVFYTGRRRWKSPLSLSAMMDIPAELAGFVPVWQTLFLKLQETPSETLTGSAVAAVLRALQASEEPQEVLGRVLTEVAATLGALSEAEQSLWRRAMLYLYLLVLHTQEPEAHEVLSDVLDEAVEARKDKETGEMARTMAQVLEQKGRRTGREEGRVEGREQGLRTNLTEVLQDKFGYSEEEAQAIVQTIPASQLSTANRRAARVTTREDLQL